MWRTLKADVRRALDLPESPSLLLILWRFFFVAPRAGRPDRLWQGVSALAAWWMAALGVEDRAPLALCFWRLFFVPPRHGQPDRLWARVSHWQRVWAAALGISPPASVGRWVWHSLMVRPPLPWPERPPLPRSTQSWLQPIEHAWTRCESGLNRALRGWWLLLARLPSPDYLRLAHQLDRAAAGLMRYRLVAVGVAILGFALVILIASTPFTLGAQLLFFAGTWSLVVWMQRIPGRITTLFLITLSLLVMARYAWWRITNTLDLATPVEVFLGVMLFTAECYTWLILILGFIQTAWPLKREPVSLSESYGDWPSVDVFIPTYNEPMSVVKPTVFAAKGIDWPADKLNIYILDDGRREAFREFAQEAGVNYMIRPNNFHAKAGNINHALTQTNGDFIAIFDCDHIPTRSFLQVVMGEFERDGRCVMVQTPHHFFSPDPFERNFDTFRRVPNEGSLFYGLVQDGNDLWNATFFCGSCAVIKRGPLLEVGGIAVETVTEDAHTALKLHRLGYRTAYLKVVLAAGLATESLSGHIGQRIRWARGMAQIFRTDNPLLGRGLGFFQRLCYSNAMLHFFYGIPRLIFLTMPLSYLFFELHVINAAALTLASYVLPHIVHASMANSLMQGKYRHSFWAEVYESVLAWYIILPTTIAFINPKLGKFNVTAKGGLIEESYFDWTISRPYLILLGLNIFGFLLGFGRAFFWNTFEVQTVVLNMIWTFFNLVMLGAAVGVATEAKQVRLAHRVPIRLPAVLYLADGHSIACEADNYSVGGLGLVLPAGIQVPRGAQVHVGLHRGDREFTFSGEVVMSRGTQLGVRFDALSMEQEASLVQCTFGRADAWNSWYDDQPVDRPLRALQEVFVMGWRGYSRLYRHIAEQIKARLPRFLVD